MELFIGFFPQLILSEFPELKQLFFLPLKRDKKFFNLTSASNQYIFVYTYVLSAFHPLACRWQYGTKKLGHEGEEGTRGMREKEFEKTFSLSVHKCFSKWKRSQESKTNTYMTIYIYICDKQHRNYNSQIADFKFKEGRSDVSFFF